MRNFTIWLICLFFLTSIGLAKAQTKGITGTVTSAVDGSTIPGVQVIVKGTIIGTTTNLDGIYELSVPASANILQFTFIGMKTMDVEIGSSTSIDVKMEEDLLLLDEVIVVAYGTSTKKSFTGSATQVSGEKLQKKNTTEFTKALAGEMAGVQIINTTGQPGSVATVRIRGYGSVNASRAPLYIVDGTPFNGDISGIDPSNIESFTVLKDATATAIYGSRGANGVLLVTTKKGRGEGKVEIDVKRGINLKLIPEYDVIETPEKYIELTWEGLRNKYAIQGEANPGQLASENLFSSADHSTEGISDFYNIWNAANESVVDPVTGLVKPGINRKYELDNWRDEIFNSGIRTEATLKMSGGDQKSSYYTSIGYLGDEGYYINSNFERFNARVNVDHSIKKWLKGGLNIAYSYSERNDPGQGGNMNNGFAYVNGMPPIFPVYVRDANGEKIFDPIIDGYMYDYGFDRGTGSRPFGPNINPAGAVRLDQRLRIRHQATVNANIEARISNNFKFTSTFGMQSLSSKQSALTNSFYGDAAGLGRIRKDMDTYISYTWNQILSFTKSIKKHNFDVFIAHESSLERNEFVNGSKNLIANPYSIEWDNAVNMSFMSSWIDDYSLESYFGQVRYDYDEKYFLHGTVRRDGTSRFPNNKWGTFGSLGAAWMISKEDFFSDISFISDMKLKASYGILGNQALGFYPTYDNYAVVNLDNQLSFTFNYKGNPNLTWEQSKTFNIGTEIVLGNTFDFEIEYYIKNTDKLLFNKQVAPSLGYADYPVNDGALKNSGLELTGVAHIIDSKDIKLDFSFNASHYASEVTHMPMDDVLGEEKKLEIHGNFGWSKGHSIFDYYLREYAGVDPQTGQSLWYKYFAEQNGSKEYFTDMEAFLFANNNGEGLVIDKETTTEYDEATKKYIGKSVIPDVMGGFGFDFQYKALTISGQFVYALGGYGYDNVYAAQMDDINPGSNNWNKDILRRWQKPGDDTDVPLLTSGHYTTTVNASSRFVTKASYLNLSNLRVAIKLPQSFVNKMKLKDASVWMAGDNLFVLSERRGYIPLTNEDNNTNTNRYSPLSTITAGIKVEL